MVIMIASQILLRFNQQKITWIKGNYTNVSLSESGELICVVDKNTKLAGAIDRKGKIVIPIKNSTFDPWTGEVIKGLRQDGNLFWNIEEDKVGIVNEENKEIIPRNYGYLEKGHENQFVAGKGDKSNVVSGGGVYIHKKYGVIDENENEIIPFEYDSLEVLEDNCYQGVIETNSEKITRTFYADGQLKKEDKKEIEDSEEAQDSSSGSSEDENTSDASDTPDTPDTPDTSDTSSNWNAGDAASTTETSGGNAPREDSGIEDYNGPVTDTDVFNYYSEGDGSKIHLEGTKCTLENESGNVLAEFEGDRVENTMPVYDKGTKLVIDNQEKFYRIYNALTGALLCDVSREAKSILADEVLVYEKDGYYIVKKFNNVEILRVKKGQNDKFLNSPDEKARFVFRNSYFVYQADTGRTLITNEGVVIAKGLDSVSFNDENSTKENDESRIYICEKDGKYGAFNAMGDRILNFDYENIEFFSGASDVLRVTKKKNQVGIVDYTGKVIIPLEYESVGYGNKISEASDTTIVEYLLLSNGLDQYYGKVGKRIYYLNEEGKRSEEVRYVRTEEKGRDLNDYLSFGEISESPKEYRATGNVLVMDNSFVSSVFFGRSEIYQKVEKDMIQFLLVDAKNEKIGIYTHHVEDFTMMGYQHIFWYVWMISSRLAAIAFVLWIICSIQYEDISDFWYFFRLKRKKKRRGKSNGI